MARDTTAATGQNYRVVRSLSELPDFRGCDRVSLDFETTDPDESRSDPEAALHPYQGGRACGFAVTADDHPAAYYVPLRHHAPAGSLFSSDAGGGNIDTDHAIRWVTDVLTSCKAWENHNIKFDAHVLACEGGRFACELHDTLTRAKIVDQQARKGGYGQKALYQKWCGGTVEERDAVRGYLANLGNKTPKLYGLVPADILGRYACADVLQNRELGREIERRRYEGDELVWKTETDLTTVLWKMERHGLRVDWEALADKRRAITGEIVSLEEWLSARVGFCVDLNKAAHIRRILHEYCRLPVLVKTNGGAPATSEDAIVEYADHAALAGDSSTVDIIERLRHFAGRSQFLKLYINGWAKRKGDDDRLHCDFNQLVRSGRMTCGDPNLQQLSLEAKLLIIPDGDGYGFIRKDYSQVEFRVMGALIGDQRVIEAYRNDPDTDFHKFVADICGIGRKPAKSINFGMGFGMGRDRLVVMLARILGGECAVQRAEAAYETYHRAFPRIKKTFDWSERLCRERGYIKTLYGRQRCLGGGNSLYPFGENAEPETRSERAHLLKKYDFCRNAFNTAVQGTAADVMKERAVALDASEYLRENDITLRLLVHDEVVAHGPIETLNRPETHRAIISVMTEPAVELGVPLAADGEASASSWAHADPGELRKIAEAAGLDPAVLAPR